MLNLIHGFLARIVVFIRNWTRPFFDPVQLLRALPRYAFFIRDWMRYSQMEGAESIHLLDTLPCIHERTATTPFDRHYFYQDIWAFRKIGESRTPYHIDIGSKIDFVGMLTVITQTMFIDIRPLKVQAENFTSLSCSIIALPFRDSSVQSISCLHVAEHIGLGRYGDSLDPFGTLKAAKELSRVLAPNGNLYFSLPIGKPRLRFNGERIHSPQQILNYFKELVLVEFSGIDDSGSFRQGINIEALENQQRACGLFWFTKH